MRVRVFLYVLLVSAALLGGAYLFQNKKIGKGQNSTIRYQLVKDWPQLPDTIRLGNPTGIGIDRSGNVVVFHRAGREWPLIGSLPTTTIPGNTILVLHHTTGKLVASWGSNCFVMPHGLTVDGEDNIWVTDVGLQQVFKFSHDGKLLLTLGQAGLAGTDSLHFNKPTDVAVATDGSVYVSDGYGNSRIVKFTPQGKYLLQWGIKGSGNGEFAIPHGIAIGHTGHVYVADRENNRIQVFDSNGGYIKQIGDERFAAVCSVIFHSASGQLFAVDDLSFLKAVHRGSDVLVIDSNGTVQTRFGRSGGYDGPNCWYHDMAVDEQGAIYLGDIRNNQLQKFEKLVPPAN